MSEATTIPDGRPVTRWLGLAVGLTLLDAVATAVWVELGIAVEGNPWLAHLIDATGTVPAMAVRAVVGVVLLFSLALLATRSRLARAALPALTLVLGAVGIWHVAGGLAATVGA
jgi:hypothetical protein